MPKMAIPSALLYGWIYCCITARPVKITAAHETAEDTTLRHHQQNGSFVIAENTQMDQRNCNCAYEPWHYLSNGVCFSLQTLCWSLHFALRMTRSCPSWKASLYLVIMLTSLMKRACFMSFYHQHSVLFPTSWRQFFNAHCTTNENAGLILRWEILILRNKCCFRRNKHPTWGICLLIAIPFTAGTVFGVKVWNHFRKSLSLTSGTGNVE